jgi:hypothetical protein
MVSFDIQPFGGAIPVRFGMPRFELIEIMGNPVVAGNGNDSWGEKLEITVGYDKGGLVNHVGLGPGNFELQLNGQVIWTPNEHTDPNPTFLRYDPDPLEHVGFLVFTQLGIKTTGFHDDYSNDLSVVVYPKGAWDKFLGKAKKPDLSKYGK